MIEAIALIKEKRAEWNELMTNKEKLTQDCLQFSPEQPEFEQFDQVILLFPVWLRNRLISAGFEPVLIRTKNYV